MTFFTSVVVAAAFATAVAFVLGISSVSIDCEVGHFDSAQWMQVSNSVARNVRPLLPSQCSAISGSNGDVQYEKH